MIRTMLDDLIADVVRLCGYRRTDLRIVARPALLLSMRRAGELPPLPAIASGKIPETATGGRYTSDLLIIHRRDAWIYRDTVMRRKIWRAFGGLR